MRKNKNPRSGPLKGGYRGNIIPGSGSMGARNRNQS